MSRRRRTLNQEETWRRLQDPTRAATLAPPCEQHVSLQLPPAAPHPPPLLPNNDKPCFSQIFLFYHLMPCSVGGVERLLPPGHGHKSASKLTGCCCRHGYRHVLGLSFAVKSGGQFFHLICWNRSIKVESGHMTAVMMKRPHPHRVVEQRVYLPLLGRASLHLSPVAYQLLAVPQVLVRLIGQPKSGSTRAAF